MSIALCNDGGTVSSLSRKTVAWAAGAALAVGGCAAGIVVATQGGGQSGGTGTATGKPHAPVVEPLRLVSITPATGGKDVNGAAQITVTYNQPLPASAPLPTLSPAIAGSWQRTGDAVVFTPETGFPAGTHVTVTVPGTAGSSGRSGSSSSFTTGKYSTLRLQEVLAQLGYLPLTWTPAAATAPRGYQGTAAAMPAPVDAGSAAAQLSAAYEPPAGTFQWEPGYPAQLHSFWAQGKPNTLDRGAITGFEADHGLPTDGVAGSKVWTALLTAAAKQQRNTHGYSYAIANKGSPETLTIWHDGSKVFSSLANTGIGVAPTVSGTFPVYEKLTFQIMQGTNPDGSHYADPVSWVSYFNGGDAVHYFPRGSFGYPQSLGCVELPYSKAKEAYPYLPYGTLVTVE
jgi:peptidoglycan hydrolase-like protein with peptidoglycan-binding domain